MARPSWFQKLQIRYLSKPATDRPVLLHLLENEVRSILEIGVGAGKRTEQLLRWYQLPAGTEQLRYVGVDPFESSEEGRAHLKLKQAHRMLSEAGVKAVLIPGDASTSLPRVSHTSQPCDLIIIDGGYDPQTKVGQDLLHWLPRLASESATVFAAAEAGQLLKKIEVDRSDVRLRRAA